MKRKYLEARLQEAFQYVRKTYFPKWDRSGVWKVEYTPQWGTRKFGAICHSDVKRIWFYRVPLDKRVLHVGLIHEICHAVRGWGHKGPWIARMRKAQEKATVVDGILAAFLSVDIDKHKKLHEGANSRVRPGDGSVNMTTAKRGLWINKYPSQHEKRRKSRPRVG